MSTAVETSADLSNAMRLLVQNTSKGLELVGLVAQMKRLRQVPVNPANEYGCAFRSLRNIEMSVRLEWAKRGSPKGSPLARVVELIVLTITAISSSVFGVIAKEPESLEWLGCVLERQAWLIARIEESLSRARGSAS